MVAISGKSNQDDEMAEHGRPLALGRGENLYDGVKSFEMDFGEHIPSSPGVLVARISFIDGF